MTRTHWIILFWVVVGGMLIWQFTSYNAGLDKETVEHPRQEHFFFFDTNSTTGQPAPQTPQVEGPDLRQISFRIENDKPIGGMFITHAVVKNVGTMKATAVQISIRPYKGAAMGDDDGGGDSSATPQGRPDSDPLSQYGQWIELPDLGPGEQAEATATFSDRPGVMKGSNPSPEIIFSKEKTKP